MPNIKLICAVCLSLLLCTIASAQSTSPLDPRNIKHGWIIPDERYSDQPYVVITNDGAWLCVMTTGKGVEGAGGQHVIAVISRDQGRTWTPPRIRPSPMAAPSNIRARMRPCGS